MTDLFPSVWQLLLPNFNIWTFIGIFLLIVGVAFLWLLWSKSALLKNFGFDVGKVGTLIILAGIGLIWGVSIFEDFVNSRGGAVVFWGLVVTGVMAIILFWRPKTQGGTGDVKRTGGVF